jgi:hypothetical protein
MQWQQCLLAQPLPVSGKEGDHITVAQLRAQEQAGRGAVPGVQPGVSTPAPGQGPEGSALQGCRESAATPLGAGNPGSVGSQLTLGDWLQTNGLAVEMDQGAAMEGQASGAAAARQPSSAAG